jgi:hypothetical protein
LNFLYKFNGVYGITEGQTVQDSENDYFRIFQGPLREQNFDRFQLSLKEVNNNYLVENSKTTAANISISNLSNSFSKDATIRANFPFKMNDMEFHFGQVNGYTPKIQIVDSSGNLLFNSFVRLAHQKINTVDVHSDFIELPELNLTLFIEILAESENIDSTVLKISVAKDMTNIIEDSISVGNEFTFENNKLIIPELRRWCYINVVESPFLNLIFFGFWSALTGMMIGLIGRTFKDFGGK